MFLVSRFFFSTILLVRMPILAVIALGMSIFTGILEVPVKIVFMAFLWYKLQCCLGL